MATSWLQLANNAMTTLATDLTSGATTMDLTSVADMPASFPFRLTIWDADLYGYRNPADDPNMEIVEVTGYRSAYTQYYTGAEYVIERGKEDTVAAAHSSGDAVALLITAGVLQQIQDAITALEGA